MQVKSIEINNFKSIEKDSNVIIVEPGITTIIGKNESGKSNILEALSYIDLNKKMSIMGNSDFLPRNSILEKPNMSFIIELSDEINMSNSRIKIYPNIIEIEGQMLELFQKNVQPFFNIFVDFLESNSFSLSSNERQIYNNNKKIISCGKLNVFDINNTLQYFDNVFNPNDVTEEYKRYFEECNEKWLDWINEMPIFFLRKDSKVLANSYSSDEARKAYNDNNSLLKDFLDVIQININDFLNCITSSKASVRSMQNRINKNIEKYINIPFQDFYSEEVVRLSLNFNSGYVYFEVESGDSIAVSLTERSNGLKWYLNLFIDILSKGVKNRKIVYLFDEPGISLHINAQKEILNLFKNLVDKGNQVIYTTHLPSMLSLSDNGIHRIRAVEKTEDGITKIFKNVYDSRLSTTNIEDTISPIVQALGMSVDTSLLMSKDRINVVVEGISDYIYLSELLEILPDYKDKIAFIPAVGANNVVNIYCILYGWSCSVIALFDYDKEGVINGENKLKKSLGLEYNRDYMYINNVTEDKIKSCDYLNSPFVIEDFIGSELIDYFLSNNPTAINMGKPLRAKFLMDFIKEKDIKLVETLKNNAKSLFDRICDSKIQ